MANVAVLGCGVMGSALASAFLKGGQKVVVYNRTKEKTAPLAKKGAAVADAPADAAAQAELVLVSLSDYEALDRLLNAEGLLQSLSGKTVVQLSTGTPSNARAMEKTLTEAGANYMDGAILGYPEQVGTQELYILYSGREDIFNANLAILQNLTPNCVYVGPDGGTASTLDMAMLIFANNLYSGFFKGAALCAAEGLPLQHFYEIAIAPIVSVGEADMRAKVEVMTKGDYDEVHSSVNTWEKVTKMTVETLRDRSIDATVESNILDLQRQAIADGYGEKDHAALFEAVKPKS